MELRHLGEPFTAHRIFTAVILNAEETALRSAESLFNTDTNVCKGHAIFWTEYLCNCLGEMVPVFAVK
jgi:hypothetical protein